jgi:hypothetical protein
VSDVSQGPGWWLASDGKWYSPEQTPGYDFGTSPLEPSPTTGVGAPEPAWPVQGPDYGAPPLPANFGVPPTNAGGSPGAFAAPPAYQAYGPPSGPPGYPPAAGYGYGYPPPDGQPYGYMPAPKTNGLAIASLVCSFFFWLYGLGAILAIIFGFIARAQIKKSGNTQQGRGLALAGIIIGIAGLVLGAVIIIVVINVVHHCQQNSNCTFNTTGG